jgi:carbamoyl-phosphate synthase large subunit
VPTTVLVGEGKPVENGLLLIIVKPRRGAGSRGEWCEIVLGSMSLGEDGLIAQELLLGDGIPVDAACKRRRRDRSGTSIAYPGRLRCSIAGRTVKNEELEATASTVARAVGLTGVKPQAALHDSNGVAALLEVK